MQLFRITSLPMNIEDMLKQAQTRTAPLTERQVRRMLENTPMCEKVGIVCHEGAYYFTLFKHPKSTKPIAVIPAIHVIMVIESYSDFLESIEYDQPQH